MRSGESMPHTQSAKKRLRQTEKRRLHNRDLRKSLRAQMKSFQKAIESGSVEDAQKEFNACAQKLDRAGTRRVYHPNKVARKKSQLTKMLNDKQKAGSTSAS